MSDMVEQLAYIEALGKRELSQVWQENLDSHVPRLGAGLLRLALAWELQAKAHGGLGTRAQRRLSALAGGSSSSTDLRPGTRLVREWQGKPEVVTIGEAGEIIWDDREWGSLSEVARAITGTRWSGPAFFGLKKKVKVA